MEEYEALYRSAKEAAASGRYQDAAQLYRQVAAEIDVEKRAVFHLLAAEAHNDAGEARRALADCRLAIAAHPDSVQAWRTMGRLLMEAQRYSDAKDALCKSLDLSPTASAHIYLNQICISEGNLVDAENHCREALSLLPGFDEAYYNLGLVLRLQGYDGEALAAFQSAVRISPDYVAAHREIGELLLKQGDYSGAEQHLRRCLSILPEDSRALELFNKLP